VVLDRTLSRLPHRMHGQRDPTPDRLEFLLAVDPLAWFVGAVAVGIPDGDTAHELPFYDE
jgi:hypothetical protein